MRYLYKNHPELLERLAELEKKTNLIGNMWNTLHQERITDIMEKFKMEDSGSG